MVAAAIKATLERAWGFAFPDDLFIVWEIAKAVDRKHPLDAFYDIGVRLEGPFRVLAGAKVPEDRDRWASDPPELFTVASGDTDGLHWGYVVHEPGKSEPVCAHFFSRDGYPIILGTTLYEALRKWLADVLKEKRSELAQTERVGEPDPELRSEVASIQRSLAVFAKHKAPPKPKRPKPIAMTLDGLGVVCAKSEYAPSTEKHPEKKLSVARRMLEGGAPGGALKIARDAYALLPPKDQAPARALLADIYRALSRPALIRALGVRDAELKKELRAKTSGKPRRCRSLDEALEDLASVQTLAISYPPKGAPVPRAEHWAAMKKLEHVTLRGIEIDLPASFGRLRLSSLELFDCRFGNGTRSLPRGLTKMHTIDTLTLDRVRDIPDDWELPKLQRVEIHETNTDVIPSFVLRAKTLTNLGIGETAIAQLPGALGMLTRLRYLNLSRNRIRDLPDVFDRLPKLTSLWIDHNRLERLPDSLGSLRALKFLSVGGNPLVHDKAERARIKRLLPKVKIYWT